jgi:DNA-binding PadR family transcriptional regulator
MCYTNICQSTTCQQVKYMPGINSFIPLQEPTFFILLSLRGGEKHGYAILKEVSLLSKKRVNLSTGTLYGALNRLLDQGLIERLEDRDGTRGKKAYRLTPRGLEVFDAEVGRMQQMLAAVRTRPGALDQAEGGLRI